MCDRRLIEELGYSQGKTELGRNGIRFNCPKTLCMRWLVMALSLFVLLSTLFIYYDNYRTEFSQMIASTEPEGDLLESQILSQ